MVSGRARGATDPTDSTHGTPRQDDAPAARREGTGTAGDTAGGTAGGTALVLGGSGFVGHHMCAAFAAAGYEVVTVSRRPVPPRPAVRGRQLDLLAAPDEELSALVHTTGPSVVVNATGAVWGVTGPQMSEVNVALVRRLVTALGTAPSRPRLIQLGSVHEYGPMPRGRTITESTPPRPSGDYGETKLRGSLEVLAATRGGRLDGVVLRIANAVGPGIPHSSLLGRVAQQLGEAADRGTPARLRLAPLRAERDFVDVRDIADAAVAAARRPVTGQVLNLGRGRAVRVRGLVDALIAASGIEATVVEESGEEARSAGVEWQRVDIAAARTALGWAPRRPMADSLRALWEHTRTSRPSRTS